MYRLQMELKRPIVALKSDRSLLSPLVWTIIFNLPILQLVFVQHFQSAKYIDEILCLLLLFLSFICKNRAECRLFVEDKRIIFCLIILSLLGIMGNVFSGYKVAPVAVILDLFTSIKAFIVFFCIRCLVIQGEKIKKQLITEIRILVPIMFACACINVFIDIGMRWSNRYGISSFTFIFDHPTNVVCIMCNFLALLSMDKGKYKVSKGLCVLIIASTLRSKAFGFIAIYLYLCIFDGGRSKMTVIRLFSIIVLLGFLGWNQIKGYLLNNDIARGALLSTSIRLANRFAPMGTGFALFGSSQSGVYYSPVYYEYGLNKVHGLSAANQSFLSDSFWPIIIGQFGWPGLIIWLILLYNFFCFISKRAKEESAAHLSGLMIFAYFIIASSSESAFFHPTSLFGMMLLGLILNFRGKACQRECH